MITLYLLREIYHAHNGCHIKIMNSNTCNTAHFTPSEYREWKGSALISLAGLTIFFAEGREGEMVPHPHQFHEDDCLCNHLYVM